MAYTFIGNNCSGAAIYKHIGMQYDNPFMWSIVLPKNYIKLIQDFDAIDFSNIETIQLKDSDTYNICKDYKCGFRQNTICMIIDNAIEVYFPHHELSKKTIDMLKNRFYKFNPNQRTPFFVIDGFTNIYSKSDLEAVLDCLKQRNQIGICVSNYYISHPMHIQIDDSTEKNGIEVSKRYIIPILKSNGIL